MFNLIKRIIEWIWNIPTFLLLRRGRGKKRLILMMSPQYVNFGDHAILEAEKRFFAEHFAEYPCVEVSLNCFELWPEYVERWITPSDVIAITGGGFLGSLWPSLQATAEDIFVRNPDNLIIVLPQTLYFKDRDDAYEKAQNIFQRHQKLVMFLRDRKSYDFAVTEFLPERRDCCRFVPDIVLYNQVTGSPKQRARSMSFCLREDQESMRAASFRKDCETFLEKRDIPWNDIKMAYRHMEFPVWLRSFFVRRKTRQYLRTRFVVTDRLHGMIFAYLTDTPCLAIDNTSKKVSGAYQWISGNPKVLLYDDGASPEENLTRLLAAENSDIPNKKSEQLCKEFDTMADVLERYL